MVNVRNPADIESYLGDTIVHISYIRKGWDNMQAQLALLPKMQDELVSANISARIMADAADRMARTQDVQRTDYKELVESGREAIPKDLVYYMIKWICLAVSLPCFTLCGCVVIGMLYFTNYKLAAAVEGAKVDLKIGQNEIKTKVSDVQREVDDANEKRE